MVQGKVKWFNNSRGYGFIEANNRDYFAHFKQIISNGYKTLEEGQLVTFRIGKSPKGECAEEIQVLKNYDN